MSSCRSTEGYSITELVAILVNEKADDDTLAEVEHQILKMLVLLKGRLPLDDADYVMGIVKLRTINLKNNVLKFCVDELLPGVSIFFIYSSCLSFPSNIYECSRRSMKMMTKSSSLWMKSQSRTRRRPLLITHTIVLMIRCWKKKSLIF